MGYVLALSSFPSREAAEMYARIRKKFGYWPFEP
jgi:hypothetical protein